VFFLLLAEIIPPTSLVVPLLGKFVLFTMILDTFRYLASLKPSPAALGTLLIQFDRLGPLTRLNFDTARPPRDVYLQYLRDSGGAQHSFPIAPDAHHVALGQTSLHQHPAASVNHETPSLLK
jgi:hypothetical protein